MIRWVFDMIIEIIWNYWGSYMFRTYPSHHDIVDGRNRFQLVQDFATIRSEPSEFWTMFEYQSVNVLIKHHPNIGDIISNRYLKVMFKIPKMGHLPNPVEPSLLRRPSTDVSSPQRRRRSLWRGWGTIGTITGTVGEWGHGDPGGYKILWMEEILN